MHKKRVIWGATAVIVLTAVLFLSSFGITRADDGVDNITPPAICDELSNPESTISGMPAVWLRDLCGVTAEPAPQTAAINAAPVFQQALAADVPVNDPAKDGGQAYVQSTTSNALNANTGTVCSTYIDTFHGQAEGKGYLGFSRSTDGGATFTDMDNIDDTPLNYGNPSLVWRKSDGNFYLAALLGGEAGTGIWQSSDDCQTFAFVTSLDERITYGVDDMEIMAVDNNSTSPYYGRFYLAWYGEFDTIQFSTSADALNWSGRVSLSAITDYHYKARTPWVTTAPNGDVFIMWNESTMPWEGDWTYSIKGVRSTNGGTAFTPITSPLAESAMPRASNVDCGYEVPGLLGGIAYYPPPPQLVAGADGVLHITYSYDPDGYDSGDVVDVFYRRSLDNGQTWEPEIRLNDDTTTTDQFFPTISVNENGRVVSSWYDRRNDPANNYQFQYFMRASADNGATWAASQLVSDVKSPVFADPTIMECYHGFYDQQFQDNDSAYLFWSDDRNLTASVYDPDVFFEKVTFPADFVIKATPAEQAVCTNESPVVDVTLNAVSGYANGVTLSVAGAPAGATVAIATNPLTPDGATTVTLSNLAGAATGSYTLTITGTENSLVHATEVGLALAQATPGGVTLNVPAATAVNIPVIPHFSWSADAAAFDYTLEVASDSGFSSIVYSETTTDNTAVPTTYLNTGTTYYWRVTANNGCGSTPSSTASFTTVDAPAILLIDDDNNDPDVLGSYTEALTAMSLDYDIWDTAINTLQPSESDLAAYDMVIWFTGSNNTAGPNQATELALSSWLPQNNCFFMSSQSYLNTITAFRSQYLGIRSYLNPYPAFTSVTGEWVVYGGLGPYALDYPFYANPQSVILTAQGKPAFLGGIDIAGANLDAPAFSSTYLGFPFEAVSALADRQEVLTTAWDWCQNGVEYGRLAGNITDLDSSLPIKSATITADDGTHQFAFVSDVNGAYSGDLRAGSYDVTIAATDYESQNTAGVVIADQAATTLDAALKGSSLTYAPPSIEDTIELGDVVTHTITLDAAGPLSMAVQLTPYTTLLDRVYGIYASNAPQPTMFHFNHNDPTTLTSLGSFNLGGSVGGDFFGDDFSVVYALADQGDSDSSNDQLVKIDTTTGAVTVVGTLPAPPGWEKYSAMGYDPVSQQMYVISSYADFFGTGGKSLHTIDVNTGQTTLLGALDAPYEIEIDSLAFDETGTLYAHDSFNQQLISIDLETLLVTNITTSGMKPFSEFNSGMDWDPVTRQMYVTIFDYINNGRLFTVDLATGETTFVESFGTVAPGAGGLFAPTWIAFASAPLPWATAVPEQVTIPANSSVVVDVAIDTRGLYEVGDYDGAVAFSGTFVNDVVSQPITMHVTCAACGVLAGDITDAWFDSAVLADLHITGDTGMDIQLKGLSSYEVNVPAGNYTITTSADGYLDEVVQVTAVNATTITTDIALTPAASFLEYSPASLDVTAQIGDLHSETVTISNTGTIAMNVSVRMDNFDVPVAVRNAALSAINDSAGTSSAAPSVAMAAPDIVAYGVKNEGVGGTLAWFNLANPGLVESSGNIIEDHGSLSGGDFWGSDYSKLYAFEESKLISLDVPTGEKEIIGALPLISTYSSYPGMAYDAVTDQMYILHAYECYQGYSLYTVDVTTAATSYVAPVSGVGCLNSLTANDTGLLYSVDANNDTLVAIDPSTGTATVVGSLGLDANSFSQGLAWDSATNQLYYAATDVNSFPFVQKLYRLDPMTGEASFIVDFGLASFVGLAIASDAAQWAELPTDTITVPPGTQATFDVTFDLSSMVKTGDYASEIVFEGNFINEPEPLPVNLALGCTDCALLTGAITAAASSDALFANIHITGPNGFEFMGYHKDVYNLTVQSGDYAFTVSRAGYVSESEVITAVANSTTTTNFALTSDLSEISSTLVELNEILPVGATITRSFTITNDGAAPFAFDVLGSDWSQNTAPAVPYTSCGAADAFGYTCQDSSVTDSPISYDWVDISTTGTALGISGANDFYAPLSIPFDFSYYGQDYHELSIHSYGQVYFEDRQPDPNFGGNQAIPMTITDGVEAFIAPLWDNHVYTENSKTTYDIQGIAPNRRVIIQWEDIETGSWPYYLVTFQVILFEEGNILMQYQTLNGLTGDSATIGIQGDPQTGLQYGYNQAVLSDGLAVCFLHPSSTNYDCSLQPPDAAWLTQTPDSGVVNGHDAQEVEVLFDATAVIPGLYNGILHFGNENSDPMLAPVTMRVVNMAVTAEQNELTILPGAAAQYQLAITNIGDITDTFTLAAESDWDVAFTFPAQATKAPNLGGSLGVVLAPQETAVFTVTVTPPANVAVGSMDTAVVQATSQTYSGSLVQVELTTTVEYLKIFLPVMMKN